MQETTYGELNAEQYNLDKPEDPDRPWKSGKPNVINMPVGR